MEVLVVERMMLINDSACLPKGLFDERRDLERPESKG
jgi:hypothetical protein